MSGDAEYIAARLRDAKIELEEALVALDELPPADPDLTWTVVHSLGNYLTVVNAAVELLHTHPNAAISTVAGPIADAGIFATPSDVKVVVSDSGRALYFSRMPIPHPYMDTSSVPPLALRHIGLYAFRRQSLIDFSALPPHPLEQTERLEQLRALAHDWDIMVHRAKPAELEPNIEVDTPEDLEMARAYLERL